MSRQRLCLRGTTDYWVNDALGQPFFSIERTIDHGILEAIENDVVPRLLTDVPGQPTKEELEADPYRSRFLMIFDREGYSPSFFRRMWQEHRIACVTYHKFPKKDWPTSEFSEVTASMPNGEVVTMKLAERGSLVGARDSRWMREVRKLTASGHQTSLIKHGYRTSGAVLPDQNVQNGVIRIDVVEGSLAEIDVRGARWFRPRYFRDRLRVAGRAPVNVPRLEEQLQRFQQDPYIVRVRARLEPGARRGESRLTLVVQETLPLKFSGVTSNYRSPSVGAEGVDLKPRVANLLGIGDEIRADLGFTKGLQDYNVAYTVPVSPWDTLIGARFRQTRGKVVEDPFDSLDIKSRLRTVGLSLEQPLLRTREHQLRIGLIGEHRESRTKILGERFCTIPEAKDCDPEVSVLRAHQSWTWRGESSVLAARSTLNFGLDILGATQNSGSVPDGEFFSWLGQLQWAMRLPKSLLETEIIARVDSQLSADPLLPIEKFAMGGARTVRGYRENSLVRDNGVVGSVELRLPLWRSPLGRRMVELAPFADLGHAWDESGPAHLKTRTIASVGLGLRVSPFSGVLGEIYWGERLRSLPNASRKNDLQDDGIQFRIRVDQQLLTDWHGE